MPIEDPFDGFGTNLVAPYSNALEILPDDDTDLPVIPRAIWCQGVGGHITMTFRNGETVTLAIGGKGELRMRPKRIHATGTTLSSVIILW